MTATLDVSPGPNLTPDEGEAIYAQGKDAVLCALLRLSRMLAERQAAMAGDVTPGTPSGQRASYQKPPAKKRPNKLGRKPGTPGRRRPVPAYVDETGPHGIFAAMSLGDRGHEDAVPDLKKLRDAEDGVVRSEVSLPIWKITGDSSGALVVGRSLLDVFHIPPPGTSSSSSPTARSRRSSDFFRRFFRIAP